MIIYAFEVADIYCAYLLYVSCQLCVQWCHIGSLKLRKVGVFTSSNLQTPHVPPPPWSQLKFYQYTPGPGCTNVLCCVVSGKALFPPATRTSVYHLIIYKREHFCVCWALLSHVNLTTTREVEEYCGTENKGMLPQHSAWLWLLGWLSPRLPEGGAVVWLREGSHIPFLCLCLKMRKC